MKLFSGLTYLLALLLLQQANIGKIFFSFFFFNLFCLLVISTIGCYRCSTLNGDIACTDPFNPGESNATNNYYDDDCRAGIEGRVGLFPAKYCLKVSGTLGIIHFFLILN